MLFKNTTIQSSTSTKSKNSSQHLELGKEIFEEEVKAISKVADQLGEEFNSAIELILKMKGKLVLCGIGKSAHIASKITATLNSTGTNAQFLHASEATHGDLGLVDSKDVALVLSKSGNTPEIKYLVSILKERCHSLIAITGNRESFLGKSADIILDVGIDKEAGPLGLAPTSSTTTQLIMGDAIAMTLMKAKDFGSDDFARFHPGGSLGKKLLLKVKDLIDNLQPSVQLDSTLQEIIISLSSGKHGITVVFDGNDLKGVITDGDLRRALEVNSDPMNISALDLMATNPKTISPNVLAKDALQVLRKYKIGQLVVFNGDKYLGILDIHDLLNLGLE